VELVEGTLPASGEFDLILANLPYVAEREWRSLQPEVTEWEPREALLAGADGLDAIRSFLAGRVPLSSRVAGTSTSSAAGAVGLEVGAGQAEAVGELMRAAGFAEIEVRKDLAGIERVVIGHQRSR
jgi:release factor glutamine methyltransferase